MNILFTICGRSGSKGVKNKNLKVFNGIPLVYYTLGAINEYKNHLGENDFIDIVLNTDSKPLVDLVCKQKELQINIIWRNEDLSGDTVPKVAVIKDCLNKMEEEKRQKYDIVVDLDITSPLRTMQDIVNAIDKKRSMPDIDVIYSVTESRRSPYFNMVKECKNGTSETVIQSNYTARQQVPKVYDMNASIYAYEPRALKEKESVSFFDNNCSFIIMKDTGVLDIDSEEDFELMQIVSKYFYEINIEYHKIVELGKELWENI